MLAMRTNSNCRIPVKMIFSLSKHSQLWPARINLDQNIQELLTELHFILQIILLADIMNTDTVTVELQQISLSCGQQEMVRMQNNTRIFCNESSVIIKLASVSNAVQLRLYMRHYFLYFITFYQLTTLKRRNEDIINSIVVLINL